MKKIFGFLTLALATTALFSCSDDDNNSTTTVDGVQIVTRPSEISPAGGESAIEVNKPVASVYAKRMAKCYSRWQYRETVGRC